MSSADVWKTWEGRVVDGKFPLRQLIGSSDHSSVFVTELQGQPNQKAALKLIPADAGDADRQLARWRDAAQLSHPHLMRILDQGSSGKTLLYIVMELAEDDLSKVLPQRALDANEVKDMLNPVLDGLAYLHSRGFVHGRVKPSNILAVNDQLKLSSDQLRSVNETGARRGRRDVYDPPEAAAGIISPAGDVWSLGVTLVAALNQDVVFLDESKQGALQLPRSMPEPYRSMAQSCLSLDPKQRPSIAEIKSRLLTGATPQQTRATAQPQPRPEVPATAAVNDPVRAPEKTAKRGWIVAVAVFVALLAGLLVSHSRRNYSSEAKTAAPMTQPAPQPTPVEPSAPVAETPAKPSATGSSSTDGAVVHQVLPDISKGARNTIHGTIKVGVRVQVDPAGKVTGAKLATAGPSAYFAREALQAAERWQFSPPQADGQPSASTWLLQFRFRRGGTQVLPERVKR